MTDELKPFGGAPLSERIAKAKAHMAGYRQHNLALWPHQPFAMTVGELIEAAERGLKASDELAEARRALSAPAAPAEPVAHRPGCPALGGYGHGVQACECGATPAAPSVPAGQWEDAFSVVLHAQDVTKPLAWHMARGLAVVVSPPRTALPVVRRVPLDARDDHDGR